MDYEEQYPSVELAYDFVIPSYEWASMRVETIERCIEGLLTYITTVTLALPIATVAIAKQASQADVTHWQFLSALGVFFIVSLLGLYARQMGDLIYVDPKKLYDQSLHEPHWEFRKNAIHYGGEHFDKNRTLIARKSRLANIMCSNQD